MIQTAPRRASAGLWPAALLALLVSVPFSAPASAHDLVRRSTPAAGATVAPGPLAIAIEFSGKIDKPLSELTLRGPNDAQRVLPMVANPTPNLLTAEPVTLSPGDYVIRWTVMSSDGHLTRGDIRFRCAPAL